MPTARGTWLILVVGLVAFWGVWFAGNMPAAAVFAVSLLVWLLFEWGWFQARATAAAGRISVERHLVQNDREQPNLWAKVTATVRVRVALKPGALALPFVAVSDRLPVGFGVTGGRRRVVGRLAKGSPVEIEYTLHPVAPGVVKFEGVEVRVADYCGLFYHRVFIRIPTEYLVLPMLADDEGGQRSTKRINALPPPGIHRLRRTGGGSELLDLREYQPGDPPKTVAWKASARRDFLITKQFENDVPVRCVLFLDASNAMRLGDAGNTPLARASAVAAAVGQAAAANRDLVGLTVFDETKAEFTKPARTQIHQMQLLRKYAETASRLPDLTRTDTPTVQRMAYSLATEMYSELLAKPVNSQPFGLFWMPLFDSRARWVLLLPILWLVYLIFLEGGNTVFEAARNMVHPQQLFPDGIIYAVVCLLIFFTPFTLTAFYWFVFGIRGFFPPRSTDLRKRKQLAALFAGLDGDTPAAVERYIADDDFFAARADRFLLAHRVQPPPKLHAADGSDNFLGKEKLPVLADALVRAVGTARDNELYVILADLVELADHLEPLLKAVRAARGRHHQVLVLLPWPSDVPPPDPPGTKPEKKRRDRLSLKTMVEEALVQGYREKFDGVRTALVRSGASVFRFDEDDPVQLILQRLEQVRGARIRR